MGEAFQAWRDRAEDVAQAYAAAGFPVFPCKPTPDKAAGSKAPYLPGESASGARDGGHWLASTDPWAIADWWERWPGALLGFPTGLRSGTVVIDLDPREAPVEDMLVALKEWCGGLGAAWRDGVLPPAVARTQSGGLHLYFRYPPAAELSAIARRLEARRETFDGKIGNRTNLFRGWISEALAPAALAHIDVRGEGGYVIAPPSVMESDAPYVWMRRAARDDSGGWLLPPLPPRLLAVITREAVPVSRRPSQPASYRAGSVSDARVRAYVEKSIAGILAACRGAPQGERNQTLFWASARLGEFVLGGVLGASEAEGLLLANLPAGVNPGEAKARKTIKSGLSDPNNVAFSPDHLRERAE